MKKSARIVVFLALLTALLLAACQPAAPATPDNGDTAGQPADGDTQPADEKIELVYWSMWNEGENQAKAIQKTIDTFEAANPNITIKATWNGRQNQVLLRNALASGTKVDFMDQDADQVAGGLVAAGQGYPLNDLLKTKAINEDVAFEEVFVPGVVHMFDVDGVTYLIPYIYNTAQFFYNKDIFDEAGVTAPETWDDLISACGAIKEAGYEPIAVESDIQGYNSAYITYLLARLKGPGWMTEAANDPTGEMWRDPAVVQAAEMARELWEEGCIPDVSRGYKWPQAQETLASGETAMELVGAWLPTELASATGPDFNWGAFNFPEIEGGEGKSTDLGAFILSYMILKDAPHPEESFEFLKYMLTEEAQKEMVSVGLVGVTRQGVDWPANIAEAQTAAENATIVFGEGDGLQGSNAEYYVKVLRDPFNDFFMGDMAPEDFADKLATDTANYWANK